MNTIVPFVLFLFWLLGFGFLWRIPNPRKFDQSDSASSDVSVIIPARNEEQNLATLIHSLKHQTLKPLEIIVVDDHSEDGTAAIAEGEGCVVLRSEDLPETWAGKPWACWQGVNKARGDILLFLDADTFLEPGGLSRILHEYREKGGLLSIQPFHQMKKAYEKLSAFFNIVAMGGMRAFTLLGHKLQPLGAFGPCMVCSRKDYFAVGGHSHEKVRGEILESLALGKVFLRAKGNVHCYGGKGSISFRMYPAGLASLIEGFSKGFGTGANAMSLGSLLMMVCWIFGCCSVSRHLIQALLLGDMTELSWSALLDALYVLQIHWMLLRIGNFGFLPALLFQVPLVFFVFLFGLSLFRIFFLRKVPWKGRNVNTRKEKS
jgi:4,4'-diaponeurosporenoate glycosyltransferase